MIIDPGGNIDSIEDYIDRNKLKMKAILNTHAHYDHIGAVNKLKKKYKIPFFLHSGDDALLKRANLYAKIFEGSKIIKIPEVDYFFDEIDITNIIDFFHVDIIFTPGHTRGGVCIFVNKFLFTGDTLLKGAVGRTDLPGGNKTSLQNSLKILSNLPSGTPIYPGHGIPSTIGEELKNNKSFSQISK